MVVKICYFWYILRKSLITLDWQGEDSFENLNHDWRIIFMENLSISIHLNNLRPPHHPYRADNRWRLAHQRLKMFFFIFFTMND